MHAVEFLPPAALAVGPGTAGGRFRAAEGPPGGRRVGGARPAGDQTPSRFVRTPFARTVLRDADLRWSTFRECDFTDADLRGAKLTHERGDTLSLSEGQRRE